VIRQGSVLVVDDSEPNRDALSRRLARNGLLVEVAAGGDDALTLARSRAFDVVLLRKRSSDSASQWPLSLGTVPRRGGEGW
jgi:DNA-binding NtrC family response regulator